MAGSDKLYLEPILKELLHGIMGSNEGVNVKMSDLVDALANISGTIDKVNNTVSGALNFRLGDYDEAETEIALCNYMLITGNSKRFEQGEIVTKITAYGPGTIILSGNITGSSGVNPNNPGLYIQDEATGQETEILEHTNNTGTTVQTVISFGVEKGHTYRLKVGVNGASGEKVTFFSDCQLEAYVYEIKPEKGFVIVNQ